MLFSRFAEVSSLHGLIRANLTSCIESISSGQFLKEDTEYNTTTSPCFHALCHLKALYSRCMASLKLVNAASLAGSLMGPTCARDDGARLS